jgi:hypothetical protein
MRNKKWIGVATACIVAIVVVVLVVSRPSPPIPEPARFDLLSLEAEPVEVASGDMISVAAHVGNLGARAGIYSAILEIDGIEAGKEDVMVQPGAIEVITFGLTAGQPGSYLISMGALNLSILVKEEAVPPCPQGSPPPEIVYYPFTAKKWNRIPGVTISAAAGDRRIQLAQEAVDFWNQELEEIGTPFRLGAIIHTTESVPLDYLVALSAAVIEQRRHPQMPESLKEMSGDVIIAFSDGFFVSFCAPLPSGVTLIGIRNCEASPLNLPNVARNLIAHELGHAIGLGHNNDFTKLMCGRPAACRPPDFHCEIEQFFSITEHEKASLSKLYPTTWSPAK